MFIKCSKCNGNGVIALPDKAVKCPKCKGMEDVDWIEQITGVKEKGILIPPGVYVREVDLSTFIDKFFTDDDELKYLFPDNKKNEYFKKL